VSQAFTIATDGDLIEQAWWPQWTRDHFPSYEAFWVSRVVPVTNWVKVRSDLRFRSDADIAGTGFTPEDVAIAQLHYTILVHLGRVFEQLDDVRAFASPSPIVGRPFGQNECLQCFARLSGASDVADELLARRASPGLYDAWNENDGAKARRKWRQKNPDPLRPVRAYRNRLVHGRVVLEVYVPAADSNGRPIGDVLTYPELEKVDSYLDWRVAIAAAHPPPGTPVTHGFPPDFAEPALIVRDAWEQVVAYVENAWKTHLVPNL